MTYDINESDAVSEINDENNRTNKVKIFDKIELFYLNALRIFTLVAATILMLCSLWFGVSGLYKIIQNPDSIKENSSRVTSSELIQLSNSTNKSETDPNNSNGQNQAVTNNNNEYSAYYQNFLKRYYSLFQTVYAKYKRPEDKAITLAEFDDAFLHSQDRVNEANIANFPQEKKDLEEYLIVITEVSNSKENIDKLTKYQTAQLVTTNRIVNDTESVKKCEYYSDYDGSCMYYTTQQVPVTRTVTEKHLPKGIIGYAELLANYHDNYFNTLEAKRKSNKEEVQIKREQITVGKVTGMTNLTIALAIICGFMVLMFFFLLIAIERHQRLISNKLGILDESREKS